MIGKKSLPLKGNDCANCSIHVMGCYTAIKNHFRVGKWLRGKTLVVQVLGQDFSTLDVFLSQPLVSIGT